MKQLEIGICDDEQIIVRQLSEYIKRILNKGNYLYKIHLFHSGESLLPCISKLNLLFLDIEMPEMDGIEVGRKIQRINTKCKIIMATGKIERVKDAFKINAFRFITKPFEEKEIQEALYAYCNMEIEEKFLELFRQRMIYKIPQKEIQYVMAYDSYTEYFVKGLVFRQKYSLNQLESLLDMRYFFRINRKYIINLHWIQNYKNGIIDLGSIQISVSKRNKKEFERKYIEFDLKYG